MRIASITGRAVCLTGLFCALLSPELAGAQRSTRGTRFGIGGGVAFLGSSSLLVGTASAAHVQLAMSRVVSRGVVAELLVDAFATEATESIVACVAPSPGTASAYCGARTERAGSLLGLSAGTRVYPWLNGFALAGAAGVYYAPSVHGPVSSTSGAVSVGATYEFTGSRLLPDVGVRYVRLFSSPGGVRWIASPEFALRF